MGVQMYEAQFKPTKVYDAFFVKKALIRIIFEDFEGGVVHLIYDIL